MNKVEFNKWVDKMNKEFRSVKNQNRYSLLTDGHKIYACINLKNGFLGIAKCSPTDEFNFSIGAAIAYARCKKYKIPKLTTYKKLSEMKYGDRFLSTFANKQYIFVGKSPMCDRYIVENVAEMYVCYHPNNDEEYEMVE